MLEIISEAETRVTQEGAGQAGLPADTREPTVEGPAQAGQVRGADIREVRGLHVAPHLLDRVQLWRVGGQGFHGEPRTLPRHVGRHVAALVPAQTVPDEDDAPPAQMPLEGAQKRHQRAIGIAARLGLEEEPTAAPIPAKGQGPGHRKAFPVAPRVLQERGLAARRPGAPDYRVLRDAAFVLEDEPGALPPGVFFSWGQRRCFHSAIAASLRSRARRPGRCSDQPSARNTRQTWPG